MARPIPARAGGILSYFTRHRTAANLLLVVLLMLGVAAVPQMRAQFFPDVVVDNVRVSVIWEGAGAEDVDRAIVQALEPSLLAVEGVESSSSTSFEGRASINLEFEPGYDMGRASDDVRQAIDSVTTLPDEAEEPELVRGVWYDRVTDLVITGPVGTEQLGLFTDELVNRLFAAGVTRTTIRGVAAPRTLIEVPSVNLMAHDVTIQQIAAAIAEEVDADPAGDVDGANARVRTGVEKRSPDQIEQIVLRSNPDGSTLTVGDVAELRVEGVTRNRSYFVGDNPAMSIRVDRSAQGDAIAIQRQVEDVAREMQATLPEGTTIDLIRTRAEMISGRLNILVDNGLMGLGLVLALLFLFLNARTAFWVAAGIPVAMLTAISLMYVAGLTINMISLFALIITLGIVVDDAIVVGEHADARARRLGESPVEAAENAARRMAMPVFSATLTTILAFFALTAISGRFGDLISDIPFTVIAVLAASLIECFLILPHHMAHALAHTAKEHWYDVPSRIVNRGFRWVRDHVFRRVIALIIVARYPVLAATVLILASQVALIARGDVPWRFFNAPESSSVTGNFAMLPGASRADSLEMMREMQRATEELAAEYEDRYGRNPLDYVLAEIGGNSGRPLPGADTKDADLLGGIAIELIDADLRPEYSSFQFVGELQDRVTHHPLAETVSFRGWRSGPGGEALDVEFYGADAGTLKAASEALKEALLRFPEVSAVEDNLAYDKEELILELTPQGQSLGFTIDAVGRVLRHRLNGLEAATYPLGPRSAEIRVQLPETEQTADFVDRMQMRAPSGSYVPLADIVSVERQTGFSTVRRENGIRLISVTGDISEDDPARAEEVMSALENEILPDIAARHQVEWRLSGLSEQENEFLRDAMTGLILCLAGIYAVLAWVFSSWTRPIVVMAIIPFGLVGTIWGHYIWDVPLSMFTVVGLLGMTGIIINDSIVLVTTIDEHAETRGLIPSIIDGAADRLRPVMLTTLTTVLGLAPLLYEKSQQAQFLKPTVITLVYGLGFGMVLVLVVVPVLIAMQRDVSRQIAALKRSLRTRALRGAMRPALVLMLAWFAVTMGWAAVTGVLAPALTKPLPALAGLPALAAGAALFLVGAVVLVLGLFVVLGLRHALRQRKPG
ncbi:efflux RND transporter permease subunit [Lutimaribacter sp. EGI FJ00015]|uniref:Efflux RND transporter permease subunit n=1 Tax=Lutimaribacter degradans TaxID=2945989 RepID=A0ACC5ZTD4_9RHOB|nr:efflux RND transporter permease subunit [Lutimaribacter sp. EGI FJ00013]MCM2561566.1 efflux RND transporter permease subunit [Lutimaribacter sp. EGI FJ00013]MCO0612723.1 efflux RND transporter permease subunit [Lutimaribacter sp. EGI FJ00015]MCO0635381.1 efflux RND transporter permease subunit [Lutimaribacter sp. EGI FJ00014]